MASARFHAPIPAAARTTTCALRETDDPRVSGVELLAVTMCLLEVVADDLVHGFASLLEPGAEAFVELGPCVLRRPGVGNVADQDVVEAVRVVVASTQGTDETPADECPQPRVEASDLVRRATARGARHVRSLGPQRPRAR